MITKRLDLKYYDELERLFVSFLSDARYQKEQQELYEYVENHYNKGTFYNVGDETDGLFNINYEDFDRFTMMAYAATHFPAFEKMLFKDNAFNHEDFFKLSYFCGFIGLINKAYANFLSLMLDEINNVSLLKLINIEWGDVFDFSYSEAEIYDLLITMNPRNVTMILEKTTNDRECKSLLKKSILDKDDSSFIETALRYNIDMNYISNILGLFRIINRIKDEIEMFDKYMQLIENNDSGEIKEHTHNYLKKYSEYCYEKEMYNVIIGLYQFHQESEENDSYIPNIDWSYVYLHETRQQAILLYIHDKIKLSVSNIETVCKVEDAINHWAYFHWLFKKIKLGEINPFKYDFDNEPLKVFREKFIQQLELPENILIGAKNTNEYLESSFAPDKWFCIRLYHALVDAYFLSYDKETFYSFIYRMSRDYKGETEPIQMVWLGEARELYYFIYRFCNNAASRIWNKTAMFFCMPEGVQLNTNGVKNQAKPTPKIESIIKDYFK